jgi:thioredoxin-related protein
MAGTYDKAVFLKLLGNANMGCKRMFKEFKIRSTPSFLFFRNGEARAWHMQPGAVDAVMVHRPDPCDV